jgi:hypothetical protein
VAQGGVERPAVVYTVMYYLRVLCKAGNFEPDGQLFKKGSALSYGVQTHGDELSF